MYISAIEINNCSRVPDFKISVRGDLVLIGANGAGKSSVLRCLDLVLGKTMQQLYREVTELDFRDPEKPLSIEVALKVLNSDEKSFFPDELGEDGESLLVRLEATLDGEEIQINRYCPNGIMGSVLTRKQKRCIGWKFISADFVSQYLNPNRKTILDSYLASVDTSDDKSAIENAVSVLSDAIDGSESLASSLSTLATHLDPVMDGGVTAEDLRLVPGAAIEGNLLSDIRLHIEGNGLAWIFRPT